MNNPIFQICFASLIAWCFLAAILPYIRISFLDNPNARSSHTLPTPRGGGISFVIVGTILNLMFTSGTSAWIPVMCLPLALIGMIDDRYNIPAKYRYLCQLLTAILLLLFAKVSIPVWTIPLAIVAITALINFMNFLDGMDGLLAGCSFLLMLALSKWSIAGAIFGFLLWNWSPAKVFMGDVGSTFIGAIYAGFALQEGSIGNSVVILALAFPLYADALTCVIRRLFAGKNIFSAHRQHLYQRLNRSGWSHQQVSSLYILAVTLLIAAKFIGGVFLLLVVMIFELCIAFYLDSKVAFIFENS
jgi:Fuc2NAc and GlcNAc transferase